MDRYPFQGFALMRQVELRPLVIQVSQLIKNAVLHV